MKEEFNLSEKIIKIDILDKDNFNEVIMINSVKEFIRLLKKEFKSTKVYEYRQIFRKINKLAGEKLTK